MNFKMTTWKYCTSIVHELRLRMHAIFKWVNVLWSVSKGALVRINTPSNEQDYCLRYKGDIMSHTIYLYTMASHLLPNLI
jgi:hypothetical protein